MPCQLVCWTVLLRPEKHHSFATRRPFVICYVSRSGIRTRSCVPLRNYDPKITTQKGRTFYPLVNVHATLAYLGWIQHSQIIRATMFRLSRHCILGISKETGLRLRRCRRPTKALFILNAQATWLGFSWWSSHVNCLPSGLLERFSKTSNIPFVNRKTSFYYPYRFGVRTLVCADTKLR